MSFRGWHLSSPGFLDFGYYLLPVGKIKEKKEGKGNKNRILQDLGVFWWRMSSNQTQKSRLGLAGAKIFPDTPHIPTGLGIKEIIPKSRSSFFHL